MRLALQRMQRIFPIGREFGAARQQALFLVGVERAERRRAGDRIARIGVAVEELDQCSGPVMKASWISFFTNTAPIGMTPLVTPLAVVIMSGMTPK